MMRDISELIHEANRLVHTETIGDITPDAILAAVVALEIARAGAGVRQGQRLEYKPAQHDDVKAFIEQYPDLNATATDIYRNTYNRDPNAAEARSTAAVLRDMGMTSTRSNGRTLWRHV
jgi:hypothetical protein